MISTYLTNKILESALDKMFSSLKFNLQDHPKGTPPLDTKLAYVEVVLPSGTYKCKSAKVQILFGMPAVFARDVEYVPAPGMEYAVYRASFISCAWDDIYDWR